MILRILVQAVGVVLVAALVGALVDPAICRIAVEHISDGLSELIEIGEKLSTTALARDVSDATREQINNFKRGY